MICEPQKGVMANENTCVDGFFELVELDSENEKGLNLKDQVLGLGLPFLI